MKAIFEKAKQNWFQIAVLILLVMCYIRLGEIKDNAFYTADIVDSSATRVITTFEDYLNEIQNNTQNTWQILDNHY